MADENFTFIEGIDPTGTFPSPYATVLLQIIREAIPNAYRGMLIYGPDTPPVTAGYEWHKRCIWIKTDDWTLYFYDDTAGSWESIFSAIPANAINGAMLQNGIVTLAKLAVGGGAAGQLIRVNSGATGFEFVNPIDTLAAGALPVNRLTPGSNNQVLWTTGGVAAWSLLNTILGTIAGGTYPVTVLQGPGASAQGKFLFANAVAGAISWEAFDLNTVQAAGSINPDMLTPGTNGQFLLTIGGQATWGTAANFTNLSIPANKLAPGADGTVLTVVAGVPTWSASEGLRTSPAVALTDGVKRIHAHNRGVVPTRVRWVLRCADAGGDAGFAYEDEVDIDCVYEGSGGGAAFLSWADDTNCYLVRMATGTYTMLNPSTGGFANTLNISKWTSVCYYGA